MQEWDGEEKSMGKGIEECRWDRPPTEAKRAASRPPSVFGSNGKPRIEFIKKAQSLPDARPKTSEGTFA